MILGTKLKITFKHSEILKQELIKSLYEFILHS